MWFFKLFKTFKYIFSGNRWCLCDISNTFSLVGNDIFFLSISYLPYAKKFEILPPDKLLLFLQRTSKVPPPKKKKKLFRRRRLYISPVKKKGIRISILFWGVNSVGKSKWVPSSSFLPLSFLPIHMAHKGASHTLAQDTSLPTFSHSRRGLRTVIVVFVVVVSTDFRGHMDIYNYTLSFARTFWLNDHDRKNFAIF